jgi:hypothetical protein
MNCTTCGKDMIFVKPEPSCLVGGVPEPESPAEWWCEDWECGTTQLVDNI